MYGTVARFRMKPGMEQRMVEWSKQQAAERMIPGWLQTVVYRTDADSNEYHMAVIFDSRESYVANAESPDQDAEYRQWAEMMDGEPEWHDGEIVENSHS